MYQPIALKTVATVIVTAAAATLLVQACGGGGAIASEPADPIEGVWDVAVTQVDCTSGATLSTFRSSQVFHRGGTFGDTSSHPTNTRGPAWGLWTRSGDNYTVRFRFIRYGTDGNAAGFSESTMPVQLGTDGNSFTATRATKVLDFNGNQVGAVCTKDTAKRFS